MMQLCVIKEPYFCRSFIRKQPTDSYVWHDPLFLDSSFAIDAVVCDKRVCALMQLCVTKEPYCCRSFMRNQSTNSYVWHDSLFLDSSFAILMQLCVIKECVHWCSCVWQKSPISASLWYEKKRVWLTIFLLICVMWDWLAFFFCSKIPISARQFVWYRDALFLRVSDTKKKTWVTSHIWTSRFIHICNMTPFALDGSFAIDAGVCDKRALFL